MSLDPPPLPTRGLIYEGKAVNDDGSDGAIKEHELLLLGVLPRRKMVMATRKRIQESAVT